MNDYINRFSYSDRDYLSLRDQLTEYVRSRIPDWVPGDEGDGLQGDPSDFATVFIEAMAYMGDLLSYYTDRAAQEATPLTATSQSTVLAWADLFGFSPALAQSASVPVVFSINHDSPVRVPHRLRLRSTTGYTFEVMLNPDPVTGDVPDYVEVFRDEPVTVTAWEGQSVYQDNLRGTLLGTSDGSLNQEYQLPHLNIDSRDFWVDVFLDTATGVQTTGDWLYTHRLLDHGSDDTVFTVRTGVDRRLYVVFGDGENGRIPPKGYTIRVYYRTTSGAAANNPVEVPPFSITMVDTSWDASSKTELSFLSVENEVSPVGGTDPDTPDIIKRKTTAVASAQRRAVTARDYEAIALAHPEILHAHCMADVASRPTVWVLPKSRSVYEQRRYRRDMLDSIRESLMAACMVGTHPDVHLGMPTPLNLAITAYTYKNIRHSTVKNTLTNALVQEFSYENLKFLSSLGTEDILTALDRHVARQLVRFVVPELTPVYPTQPTAHDPAIPNDKLGSQRFLPRDGELLYLDSDNLSITVIGGVNDMRQD